MAKFNVIDAGGIIRNRQSKPEFTFQNNQLKEACDIYDQNPGSPFIGRKWLFDRVPQLEEWCKLSAVGLDGLAMETLYAADGGVSFDAQIGGKESLQEPFRNLLNHLVVSTTFQARRNAVRALVSEFRNKVILYPGSGSAMAEIDALTGIDSNNHLICVDMNQQMVDRALSLHDSKGAEFRITGICDNAFTVDVGSFNADVLLSIGCAGNYLSRQQIVGTLAKWLTATERVITDFVYGNDASMLNALTKIVGWPVVDVDDVSARGLRIYASMDDIKDVVASAAELAEANVEVNIYNYIYGCVVDIRAEKS